MPAEVSWEKTIGGPGARNRPFLVGSSISRLKNYIPTDYVAPIPSDVIETLSKRSYTIDRKKDVIKKLLGTKEDIERALTSIGGDDLVKKFRDILPSDHELSSTRICTAGFLAERIISLYTFLKGKSADANRIVPQRTIDGAEKVNNIML